MSSKAAKRRKRRKKMQEEKDKLNHDVPNVALVSKATLKTYMAGAGGDDDHRDLKTRLKDSYAVVAGSKGVPKAQEEIAADIQSIKTSEVFAKWKKLKMTKTYKQKVVHYLQNQKLDLVTYAVVGLNYLSGALGDNAPIWYTEASVKDMQKLCEAKQVYALTKSMGASDLCQVFLEYTKPMSAWLCEAVAGTLTSGYIGTMRSYACYGVASYLVGLLGLCTEGTLFMALAYPLYYFMDYVTSAGLELATAYFYTPEGALQESKKKELVELSAFLAFLAESSGAPADEQETEAEIIVNLRKKRLRVLLGETTDDNLLERMQAGREVSYLRKLVEIFHGENFRCVIVIQISTTVALFECLQQHYEKTIGNHTALQTYLKELREYHEEFNALGLLRTVDILAINSEQWQESGIPIGLRNIVLVILSNGPANL